VQLRAAFQSVGSLVWHRSSWYSKGGWTDTCRVNKCRVNEHSW
jgi:hypothetical protein